MILGLLKPVIYAVVFLVSFIASIACMVLWRTVLVLSRVVAALISAFFGRGKPFALWHWAARAVPCETAGARAPGADGTEGIASGRPNPESDQSRASEIEPAVLYMPSEAPENARGDGAPTASVQGAPAVLPENASSHGAAPVKRRVRHERRWTGRLAGHGVGHFSDPATGREYQSYYVSLDADDGSIVTKRGVELEHAIAYAGVKPGDRVELLFLGREAVEVNENGESARRYRNRWRINPID